MALQIKRNLTFDGSLKEAVAKVIRLTPQLKEGEPLLCKYKESDKDKYFLCIGIGSGNVRILPSYESLEELISFIQTNSQIKNLIDSISEESDLTASPDSEGKLILKLKDEIINWIELSNEI